MVTLAMQLGALELELAGLHANDADVRAAIGVLDAARSSSDAALAAMRCALLDLKPADVAPLPTTCVTRLDVRFAPEIEHAAFLFASKTCTNALRHAGATRIDFTTTAHEGHLEVIFEDDGAVLRPGNGLTGRAA